VAEVIEMILYRVWKQRNEEARETNWRVYLRGRRGVLRCISLCKCRSDRATKIEKDWSSDLYRIGG
jgi:hypothetical protein